MLFGKARVTLDVEEIYRRYGPFVMRRCQQMLQDEAQAREATQDVFVQVLRRQDTLHDQGLGGLLYRMATNLCMNRLRSRRRRPHEPAGALLDRIADSTSESSRSEARDLLDRALEHAPDSTAVIAVLHLHDGLTLEQTAKLVGMSVSGIRHRLRALKATLEELRTHV